MTGAEAKARELLQTIVAATRGQPDGIRLWRLLVVPEAELAAIRDDVDRLCRVERPSMVTDATHVTNWTAPRGEVIQFSLLNRTGRFDDFSVDHDLSCAAKHFHHAGAYPALARWLDTLPHLVNARINVLGPDSHLAPHQEQVVFRTKRGTIGARLRFHLPLVTSEDAELALDGEVHHLRPGVVHYVNHGCVHAARNAGDSSRVHLVWDMLFTEAAHACMFGGASGLDAVPASDRHPTPRRRERVGAHRRLPSTVPSDEVDHVELCDPQ